MEPLTSPLVTESITSCYWLHLSLGLGFPNGKMYGCGCKDWLRSERRNGFPEAGLEGKIGEAFRPAAPCPQEHRSRWPMTDDFTGCVAET